VLKTYEGAGHFVPEEKPILVAEDIPRYFSE
jgi:pimeloyl-ACP methyl ester carboxylesterase